MNTQIIPVRTDKGQITIGETWQSTGSRKVSLVNPEDRYTHRDRRWILSFGAYGDTHLLVWSDSLDDAIEIAAGWLADNAPGHIMAHDDQQIADLAREQCEERGLAWPIPDGAHDEPGYAAAIEASTADLTYTESGYLCSWEWGVTADNPTRAQLLALTGTVRS